MGSVIAIDFDDTFTADPHFWATVIRLAQDLGHRVLCVTARRHTEENEALIADAFHDVDVVNVPTYFTSLAPKDWFMQVRGIKVDIWIDDNPKSITVGH
jgi:hypothetical protein